MPLLVQWNFLKASAYDLNAVGSASLQSGDNPDSVPMPIVLIDQESDSEATIVQLSFGDRLGALLDTMKALKDLGLDVSKGTVSTEGLVKQTKFFITQSDTGRKVEDPDMLERIRLTIINNLLKYHPESSELLAMGEVFGIKAPKKKLDDDIKTRIQVKEDGPKRSLLYIETADRPGLLVEIIKVIADVNIDVESAEIDTEGLVAKDTFHVSYGGAALNSSMAQVLVNCLRYYLRTPETDIDSY
ncbi:ACT domain-containing protein ACR12 [Glycine soja]